MLNHDGDDSDTEIILQSSRLRASLPIAAKQRPLTGVYPLMDGRWQVLLAGGLGNTHADPAKPPALVPLGRYADLAEAALVFDAARMVVGLRPLNHNFRRKWHQKRWSRPRDIIKCPEHGSFHGILKYVSAILWPHLLDNQKINVLLHPNIRLDISKIRASQLDTTPQETTYQ